MWSAVGGTVMAFINPVDRLRRPEYTGQNRCWPCTIVNSGIAVVLAVLAILGVLGVGLPPIVAIVAAGFVLGVATVLIYLRGYLVPGTPTVTQQYLPAWFLRVFGKVPEDDFLDGESLDIEQILTAARAIEECADADDLCLTASFEQQWFGHIDDIDPHVHGLDVLLSGTSLADEIDSSTVSFDRQGTAFVALVDGTRIARWESEAACRADIAAARLLQSSSPGWERLSFLERSEVAGSLRLWLEQCPDCAAQVAFDQETVSSCCYERKVLAATCNECGVRLFEANVTNDMLEA